MARKPNPHTQIRQQAQKIKADSMLARAQLHADKTAQMQAAASEKQKEATEKATESLGKFTAGVSAHFAGVSVFATGLNSASLGLIAFKGAISLVEAGLSVLSKSATELVGAMAKLGGAKGIQEMMVEAVTNQSLLNQTRFTVTSSERATGGELKSLTEKLSENVQAGAFAKSDWLQTIRQIGIVTGQQKSLDEGTLTTLGKFAVVTGSTIEEQGDIFSRLRAQNRRASNAEIIQQMLNLHAVGQRGSFSEAELAKSPNLLGLANLFSGDSNLIKNFLGAAGSALVSSGGATDQNMAGTMLKSILGAARLSNNPIWGYDAKIGQFTDPERFLNAIANTPQDILNKEMARTPNAAARAAAINASVNLRAGLSNAAGVANDESSESQAARSRFIHDMLQTTGSLENLQREFDQTLGPQERFRAAFNLITDHLEAKFLQTLIRMQPKLDAFATVIVNHEDDIGKFFDKLAVYLGVAVELFPSFLTAIITLASAVGSTAEWILEARTGAGRETVAGKIKDITDSLNDPKNKEYYEKNPDRRAAVEQSLRDAQSLQLMYQNEKLYTPEALAADVKKREEDQATAVATAQAQARENENYAKYGSGANKPGAPIAQHPAYQGSIHAFMSRENMREMGLVFGEAIKPQFPPAGDRSVDGHH